MTTKESKQAARRLAKYCDRIDTVRDKPNSGRCVVGISATFKDGHSKIFWSIDAALAHADDIDERAARHYTEGGGI